MSASTLAGRLRGLPGRTARGTQIRSRAAPSILQFHESVRAHRERLARSGGLPPSHPWWGVDGYPDATAVRNMRALVLETLLGPDQDTRVVGFK